MASARTENFLPSQNSFLFNLAADWIMRDLAKGLEDPRFPKKLHEAFWWGNLRWAIVIALGVTGTAVAARNYFFNEDRSNALPLPEPKSTPLPTERSTQHTASSTPYPTNTELPPTPKPLPSMTFTLPPTETPIPTATFTATKEPPFTPTLLSSDTPFVVDISPTKIKVTVAPTPTEIPPPANPFEGWKQNQYGPAGELISPLSSKIDPVCKDPRYQYMGVNNFAQSIYSEEQAQQLVADILETGDYSKVPANVLFDCDFYEGKVAVEIIKIGP